MTRHIVLIASACLAIFLACAPAHALTITSPGLTLSAGDQSAITKTVELAELEGENMEVVVEETTAVNDIYYMILVTIVSDQGDGIGRFTTTLPRTEGIFKRGIRLAARRAVMTYKFYKK